MRGKTQFEKRLKLRVRRRGRRGLGAGVSTVRLHGRGGGLGLTRVRGFFHHGRIILRLVFRRRINSGGFALLARRQYGDASQHDDIFFH
jgi:hypothetical protein